jgi:hypothetical protein
MESTVTREWMWKDGKELVEMMIAVGMTPDDLDRMRKSKESALSRKMLGLARGGYESLDERFARRIMGENIFGRDEWSDASTYGVSFTSKRSRIAAKFPWSEALLDSECPFHTGKAVSETHFAFLGIHEFNGQPNDARGPLTIARWQAIHPESSGSPRLWVYSPNEEFATVTTCESRWYLALKEIAPGSVSTSWDNMQGMIPEEYRSPSPVEEATKDLLVYRKLGIYPNRDWYAATDTLYSYGGRVMVGCCIDGAVDVGGWDGRADDVVGLGLVRK